MPCDFTEKISHITPLTLHLVRPWLRTNLVVCEDPYSASVQRAEVLLRYGMRFTGMVKSAVKDFLTYFLASKELTRRGDNIPMMYINEYSGKSLMAILWMNRERRLDVSSGHKINEGAPICREQWRAVNSQNTKI